MYRRADSRLIDHPLPPVVYLAQHLHLVERISVKTTVVGSYPKINEDPHLPNLRNALNHRDQGAIDDDDLQKVYDQTIARHP